MNREIEFRGKRIENNEWVYGSLLTSDWNVDEYDVCAIVRSFAYDYNVSTYHVHPKTVGQYTELKDKNGVKIFEGDKVRFAVFDHNGSDTLYEGVIVYTGTRYMIWNKYYDEFYGSDGGFDLDFICQQDEEIEVIGNIHEKDATSN